MGIAILKSVGCLVRLLSRMAIVIQEGRFSFLLGIRNACESGSDRHDTEHALADCAY